MALACTNEIRFKFTEMRFHPSRTLPTIIGYNIGSFGVGYKNWYKIDLLVMFCLSYFKLKSIQAGLVHIGEYVYNSRVLANNIYSLQ